MQTRRIYLWRRALFFANGSTRSACPSPTNVLSQSMNIRSGSVTVACSQGFKVILNILSRNLVGTIPKLTTDLYHTEMKHVNKLFLLVLITLY